MTMIGAFTAALEDADVLLRDEAAVALARHYCKLIDEADALAGEAALAWSELEPDDMYGRKRLQYLEQRVQAYTIAADLGPKLEKVLTALGMTLQGRGQKGKEVTPGVVAGADELAELRANRARRAG